MKTLPHKTLLRLLSLLTATACCSVVFSAEPPATPASSATAKPVAHDFHPPYPERSNPFQLPDSKAALATRREAVVQHIDLRLKGFVNVGGTVRAVVAIDGEVTALAVGDRRADIQILEVTPPTLTLQRGRHRWTESLLNMQVAKGTSSAK